MGQLIFQFHLWEFLTTISADSRSRSSDRFWSQFFNSFLVDFRPTHLISCATLIYDSFLAISVHYFRLIFKQDFDCFFLITREHVWLMFGWCLVSLQSNIAAVFVWKRTEQFVCWGLVTFCVIGPHFNKPIFRGKRLIFFFFLFFGSFSKKELKKSPKSQLRKAPLLRRMFLRAAIINVLAAIIQPLFLSLYTLTREWISTLLSQVLWYSREHNPIWLALFASWL